MLSKVAMFKKELSYIKTDWVKDFTIEIINNIPDYFFEIPASSTGKYHPEYSLGKGGLLRHTEAACKIANDVCRLEWLQNNLEKDEYNHADFIIAALILHDVCKSGYPEQGKYTKHEHPLLAADLIRDTLKPHESESDGDNKIRAYIKNVCDLVSSHMGEWNTNRYSKIELPLPKTFDQFLVHMFDYLASRKYLIVNLDD